MKTVRYVGPFAEVEIEHTPGVWVAVEHGQTVDVSDRVASSLLDQPDNWEPASKAKPARSKKPDAAPASESAIAETPAPADGDETKES